MARARVLGVAGVCTAVLLQGMAGSAATAAAHGAHMKPLLTAALPRNTHASASHTATATPAPDTHATAPTIAGPSTPADPVTLTRHSDLGFNTSFPVSADTGVASPPCLLHIVGICAFHGAVAFSGTLQVGATFATDVALSYDPASL